MVDYTLLLLTLTLQQLARFGARNAYILTHSTR